MFVCSINCARIYRPIRIILSPDCLLFSLSFEKTIKAKIQGNLLTCFVKILKSHILHTVGGILYTNHLPMRGLGSVAVSRTENLTPSVTRPITRRDIAYA